MGRNAPYVFKIQGTVYHHQGSLIPKDNDTPTYAQLYIYDPQEVLQYRYQNRHNSELRNDNGILGDIQEVLYQYNPFVHIYKQTLERF